MLISETKRVTREIYVAPCYCCGSTNILLHDANYSSFNVGGGYCKDCKRESTGGVSCLPTMDDLAQIWNLANDTTKLIEQQYAIIAKAQVEVKTIRAQMKKLKQTKGKTK